MHTDLLHIKQNKTVRKILQYKNLWVVTVTTKLRGKK